MLRQRECRGRVGQEGREQVRNLVVVVSVLSGRAMLLSHVLKESFWLLGLVWKCQCRVIPFVSLLPCLAHCLAWTGGPFGAHWVSE